MYVEAKEVKRQFELELNNLLKKYNAIIELEDLPTRHAYSIPEKTIKVFIPASYRQDGKCLAEWTEIDLGSYLDGN